MLPDEYIDVGARNVTPVCPVRSRIGLGFNLANGKALRLALTESDARFIHASLADYISDLAATQSPGSALMPSAPMSVPSDGVKV